jgi:hypothetical protein
MLVTKKVGSEISTYFLTPRKHIEAMNESIFGVSERVPSNAINFIHALFRETML